MLMLGRCCLNLLLCTRRWISHVLPYFFGILMVLVEFFVHLNFLQYCFLKMLHQFFYYALHQLLGRGGLETRCFETETRLWGNENETRRDFGEAKPKRGFGVVKSRRDETLKYRDRDKRDTKLYVNVFV